MAFCALVYLVVSAAAKLSVPLEDLDVRATEQLLHDWDLHNFLGQEVTNIPLATFVTRMPYSRVLLTVSQAEIRWTRFKSIGSLYV